MKCHSYAAAGHCELCNSGLEECSGKIAFAQFGGLLEETVCLVGIAQVSRRNYHISHLLSQLRKHCRRCTPCGIVPFLLNCRPINLRCLAAEPFRLLCCQFRICSCPGCLEGLLLSYNLLEFSLAGSINFGSFREDGERIFRISAQGPDCVQIGISAERCTVSGATVLIAAAVCTEGSLTHNGVADDESRLALEGYGLIQCSAYLSHVISVYFNDMPSPGAIFCGYILCVNHFRGGGELDSVGIIEHRQVVQSQRTCNAACSLGNFLLNSSVRNVGIYPLPHNIPQTGLQEFGCDGRTHREGMPLSKRA